MTLMPITLINILYAILLTSITGAIFTVLFVVAGRVLERMGFLHIRYELLKVVAFFYLCPVAYLFLKLFEMEIGYGKLFNPTPFITGVSIMGMQLWCMGVVLGICCLCYDLYRLKRQYREVFECKKWVQELFSKVEKELGVVSANVQLCQSYHAKIPCLVGIRKPKIILPVEAYDEETLRMILLHELIHYKQKDVMLKRITFCILIIHFFNPVAWLLFCQVQKQSEYVCDYRATRCAGDIRLYVRSLMLVADEDKWFSVLSSQLYERKHDLVKRINKMRETCKVKKRSKWSVAFVLAIVVLTSNMSVYAASQVGVDAYLDWYEETDVMLTEQMQEPMKYEEIISYGTESSVVTVVADMEQATRDSTSINWTVNNNVQMCTPYFSCEKGDRITIAVVVEPTDVNITVGLERSDGMKVSIYGKESIMHTFTLPYGGSWRVFVQNQSGETITAEGCYIR